MTIELLQNIPDELITSIYEILISSLKKIDEEILQDIQTERAAQRHIKSIMYFSIASKHTHRLLNTPIHWQHISTRLFPHTQPALSQKEVIQHWLLYKKNNVVKHHNNTNLAPHLLSLIILLGWITFIELGSLPGYRQIKPSIQPPPHPTEYTICLSSALKNAPPAHAEYKRSTPSSYYD